MSFLSPKTPAVPAPAPTPPPSRSDADVTAAADAERRRAAAAGGRGSTILTAGLGTTDGGGQQPDRRKTLLGA